MIIIFAGTIGRSGLGGQAWAGLQYLLGLRALGHEVYYLEDCGRSSWVYIWETEDWTHELDYPAAYVGDCLKPFGLGERWIYRDNYRSVGMDQEAFLEVCKKADLLIMRAAPFWTWREEYDAPQRRAYIDVDPGFTQISIANGDQGLADGITKAERRFTYGVRLGKEDCTIPADGGPWLPTLPPVYLPEWPVSEAQADAFTSVMRWQGFKEVVYQGVSYGQRDQSFPRYYSLPSRSSQKFRLAQMGARPETLSGHGWEAVPGEVISRTPQSYHEFIQQSRGEFGIPKQGYVAMRGGWFSDRSVCYLASGRPVLMEDTGLADQYPLDQGLITFETLDQAVEAIHQVNQNYEQHRQAARQLAETTFSTDIVLPKFLDQALT